jgi:hypothetical protein
MTLSTPQLEDVLLDSLQEHEVIPDLVMARNTSESLTLNCIMRIKAGSFPIAFASCAAIGTLLGTFDAAGKVSLLFWL